MTTTPGALKPGTFKLSAQSERTLLGVHEDLVKIVRLAIKKTRVDFKVGEGVRSMKKQQKLLRSGATRTLNSRHLTGHAVDLYAMVGSEIRWDWPLYYKIAEAMKEAAAELGVPLEWGGDWRTFKDGPHFQLPWSKYPI